jgi:uncharacterized protein HemX
MPSDGPSKEELEYYYKNSRKYFDELANYYYNADREYYNKFIAPFYSTFAAITSSGKRGSKPALIVSLGAAVAALVVAGAVFFLVQTSRDTENEHDDKTEKVEKNTQKNDEFEKINADTSSENVKIQSDYQKGLKFFNQKDYDIAEKYFRKVGKTDENYRDAQKKIEEIENIKKDAGYDSRYTKPKPVERIR